MSNLISNDNKYILTGALNDHFDTFSRNITIYKKPIINSSIELNSSTLAGYGPEIQNPNISYTVSSGIFPAIRINKNNQEMYKIDEIKSLIVGNGLVRIKVKEDAMHYIENGGNESVDIDGLRFTFDGNKHTQNYLGLIFYIYYLKATE